MIKLLKKIFKKNGIDYVITLCILFLAFFGIVMIGSACIGQTASKGDNFAIFTMAKQTLFVGGGLFLMIFLTKFYKSSWVNPIACTFFSVSGLILMIACILWDPVNNSQAWLRFGPITVQPSEFMKIILIADFAYIFSDIVKMLRIPKRISLDEKKRLYLIKVGYCIGIPAFLLISTVLIGWKVQNDLGSMLIVIFVSGIVFLCSTDKFYKPYKKICFMLIPVLVIIILLTLKPHQSGRFSTLADPLADPYNNGFHLVNSLIAFSGGLFGKGFGKSTLKYGFIPESHNDFIFPIIFEELGLIGLLCVFVPYCYIIFKLFYYSVRIKNEKDKLILIGIASYFFAHMFINIGGVSGLIPMTGVPLLLVSNGGSSVLASLSAIGIAQSIISKYRRRIMKEQL